MNNYKKITFIILIFLCFILSSCGIKSSDDMKIDNKFNGNRSIHLIVDKNNAKFFKDGLKGLASFLRENVNAPLDLTVITETDEKLETEISLGFEGLKDYVAKVTSLYELAGIDDKPKTRFKSSYNNIFIKGIDFYDDVTSDKLLKHLVDKAVSEKLIEKNNADKILPPSNYSLKYNNETLITSDEKAPYQVNNYEYLGPSQYILSTAMQEGNTWNRVFSIVFPVNNIEKLKVDWKKALIHNSNMKELEKQEINDQNGDHAMLYKFALDKQSVKAVEEATSEFLQADVNLDLSIVKNAKAFSIDYNIKEKIYGIQDNDNFTLISLYYTRPKASDMHYPISNSYMSELSKVKDAVIVHKSDLLNGYKETKNICPKFSKADIKTNIHADGSLEREIKIIKGSDFYANMGSELISNYLADYNIQTSDDSKMITIKYGNESFEKKNKLFFDKNPEVKVSQSGLFGYKIDYKDDSSFNRFSIDDVDQVFIGPNLATTSEKNVSYSDDSFNNQINVTGTKVSHIIIFAGILLALAFLVFAIVKLIRKHRLAENASANKQTEDDTQPIPTVNNLDIIDEERKDD